LDCVLINLQKVKLNIDLKDRLAAHDIKRLSIAQDGDLDVATVLAIADALSKNTSIETLVIERPRFDISCFERLNSRCSRKSPLIDWTGENISSILYDVLRTNSTIKGITFVRMFF
jgi:hypothetical protein